MEEEDLEDEGDQNIQGVLNQTNKVGLLYFEGKYMKDLLGKTENSQNENTNTFKATLRYAEDVHVEAIDKDLNNVDNSARDGEGGPVHVPEVPEDDGGGGSQALRSKQAKSSVEHVGRVLNIR